VPDRRRAWGRALLQAAPDAAMRAAYGEALDLLARLYVEDGRLRDYLRDPAFRKADKRDLLAAALRPPADEVFERFCGLIVDKGRAFLLPAIAAVYRRALDAEEGLCRLEIEAAREPDPATLGRIAEAWRKSSGSRRVAASVRVEPGLIAGYRLRAGSIRIDYSIAGRLERLRRELARPLGKG
jgi:F-type H+-transporting ATPase subunit delta